MRTPVCLFKLNHECCCDLSPVPGALQSAQTSVLCSFLDISTEAGVSRRWMMSAAPALRCIHPQSPHPNNSRNLVSGPTDVCRQPMRRLPQSPPGSRAAVIGSPRRPAVSSVPLSSSSSFALFLPTTFHPTLSLNSRVVQVM